MIMRSKISMQLLQLLILLFAVASCTSAADPRLVFAHYLIYAPDRIEVLKQEIQVARSKGIDAFALNTNVWRRDRADAMYQAAKELGPNFKLFFSADIHKDSNGNLSPADIHKDSNGNLSPADIVEMMTRYKSHPNQLRFRGKQFFTAWLGSDDSWWEEYGYSSALGGWTDVFNKAGGKANYFFVPFFPTDGSYYGVLGMIDKFNDTIDGLMAWDTSAWPYYDSALQTPTDERDRNYLKACNDRGKAYMPTPSPWFFKYIQNTCCSSECQTKSVGCGCQVKGNYQGPGLWLSRWQQIISLNPPLVEIVTWNDWVESSYVAPLLSVAASDVADFTHQAFLDLGEHYIRWYKTGVQPPVTHESLYLFYYTHSKNANAAAKNCNVANYDALSDKVFVTAVLTWPACVELRSGVGWKTFNAPAGISTWSMDFSEGQQAASLKRGGRVVKCVVGNKSITNTNISTDNFNVYSASSDARNSRQM